MVIGAKFIAMVFTVLLSIVAIVAVLIAFVFVTNFAAQLLAKAIGWNIRDFWQWSGIENKLLKILENRKNQYENKNDSPS